MTSPFGNPWAERFVKLIGHDEISRRIARPPSQFSSYEGLSPKAASQEFVARLEATYYPSAQCIQIISGWMELALDHCNRYYHDPTQYLSAVYSETPPLPIIQFPMCLTGLAGTGKSQLLKALSRLMPPDTDFQAPDKTIFRMESHRIVTVQVKGAAGALLAGLVGQESKVSILNPIVRRHAYRDGWAFLGIDELQYLSQSQNSNALLTKLLLLVAYIGIPVVYGCNFSAIHKLIRRNQEDRQRLLGTIQLLNPERPDSSDWKAILEWHKKIAPAVFEFDPNNDAAAIHQLTAGINRAENALMALAFGKAMEDGKPVRLRELESAYKSSGFAMYRADIELLAKLPFDSSLQDKHKDLWCPVAVTPRVEEINTFADKRQERAGAAAIEASLNADERQAYAKTSKPSKPKQANKRSNVVPINKTKPSAEQLKRDAVWFDDNS